MVNSNGLMDQYIEVNIGMEFDRELASIMMVEIRVFQEELGETENYKEEDNM